MKKDELNKRLEPHGLRLTINRIYSYDMDKYVFDAYFEYFKNTDSWGILHTLGRFSLESSAIDAACYWLRINKYI